MSRHFIFEPGVWIGAGQVTFSISPDLLYFRTRWDIMYREEDELFQCSQRVEVVGGDQMVNVFSVLVAPTLLKQLDTTEKYPEEGIAFEITLQNALLGIFAGSGVAEDKLVAWEFRSKGALEGYEVYEKTQEDEYAMRAEYVSGDGSRTSITGKIWKGSDNE